MARKTSRQAIEKRIRKSIQCLSEGDAEEAIYNIAPAIDVLAKERHKDKPRVRDRVKAFIFDEQQLLYYLSTQGRISMPNGIRIVMVKDHDVNETSNRKGGELADYIYHYIRCAQSHDAEIDYDQIDIGRNFGIGREGFEGDGGELKPGYFIISNATIMALILSIICAPENKRIKLDGDLTLYGRLKLDKSELVGNKQYLMSKLNELFSQNS